MGKYRLAGHPFAVIAVGVAAAVTTALIAILGQREPVTASAVSMNPDTGELVSSEISAGFRYPSLGTVAVLALLVGCVAAALAMAWIRRSEMLEAGRRAIRPPQHAVAVVEGDVIDLLDNATMESLD